MASRETRAEEGLPWERRPAPDPYEAERLALQSRETRRKERTAARKGSGLGRALRDLQRAKTAQYIRREEEWQRELERKPSGANAGDARRELERVRQKARVQKALRRAESERQSEAAKGARTRHDTPMSEVGPTPPAPQL
jgi:hypothetical protein